MDFIKQQKTMFEKNFPYRVAFMFGKDSPSIVGRFNSESHFLEEMKNKTPFIYTYYFDNDGGTKRFTVTKAHIVFSKAMD